MDEKPPNDGHRQNILTPEHNGVGIAISYATRGTDESSLALTQEFIDHYGVYSRIPTAASPGETIHVAGQLAAGVKVSNITLCTDPAPKPMTVEQLNATNSYEDYEKEAATFCPVSRIHRYL